MKFIGRILLFIGSILFLISAVLGIIAAVQTIREAFSTSDPGFRWIATEALKVLLVLFILFGAIGGIFYAVGAKPFHGWVKPLAYVILILYIVALVLNLILVIRDEMTLRDFLISMIPTGVAEVCYVLGYFWARD